MLHLALVISYFTVLAGLSMFGLHRLHLVVLCWRHRQKIAAVRDVRPMTEDELPVVTIQLPLFNEATVTPRLIEAVAKMDYPADKPPCGTTSATPSIMCSPSLSA